MKIFATGLLMSALLAAASARASDVPCSEAKRKEVLAAATDDAFTVNIDCKLVLSSVDRITKNVRFVGAGASNASLDCGGGKINQVYDKVKLGKETRVPVLLVQSKKIASPACTANPWDCQYSRPENVTIKNCGIDGMVGVSGISDGLENSRHEDYTAHARAASPTNITFENLTITPRNKDDMFYVWPGSTKVRLLHSHFKGTVRNVAVYLDAETQGNVLDSNRFEVHSENRELVAIDGSSDNTIINNSFADAFGSPLQGPGIRLYRNCGEGGTIRHNTPSRNKIINNIFYYGGSGDQDYAVNIGSRNWAHGDRFCDKDDGYAFGSSADNYDNASANLVLENQLVNGSLSQAFRVGRPQSDANNVIEHNEQRTQPAARQAGCYARKAYFTLIPDGNRASIVRMVDGSQRCTTYSCDNSVLSEIGSCQPTSVAFDCNESGNNEGCDASASCPSGMEVIGATAACNLETNAISSEQLNDVPVGKVKVVEESDHQAEGSCYVGSSAISHGETEVHGPAHHRTAVLGCQEHDNNGGDCHVKGKLYCL